MRNFLTLFISLGLLVATGATAWVFVSLSQNVEMSRTEPGNAGEIRVP